MKDGGGDEDGLGRGTEESSLSLRLSKSIPLVISSGEWDETTCLTAHENKDRLGESIDDILHSKKMTVNHMAKYS